MSEICRTCLREVAPGAVTYYLDARDAHSETITIRCKLSDCVPEMDLDVVPNAFICGSCFESLTVVHEFKNKCLETEGRIQSYIEQMGYALTSVDLRDIVRVKKLDSNQNAAGKLDLSHLKCDAGALFAVPKIAQLLAEAPRDLKCGECAFRARDDAELKNHRETHEMFAEAEVARLLSEAEHKCLTCGYKAAGNADLKAHEETHLTRLPLSSTDDQNKCSHCTYVASSDLDLKSHEESHFTELHKCPECNYTAPKRQMLIVHMRKHSEQAKCDCGFSTPYRASSSTQYKCTACDYKSRLKPQRPDKPYKCLLCEYATSHKSNLGHHLRQQHSRDRYRCKTCDYRTSHKLHLQRHLRSHAAGERHHRCGKAVARPYACSFCDYGSSEKINLIKHLMTHTDRSFECLNAESSSGERSDGTDAVIDATARISATQPGEARADKGREPAVTNKMVT